MPSSKVELVAFGLLSLLAVGSAVATISYRSAIRCAVGLFFHILSLAGLYMTLSAHFLAAVQLIVYVGAVVVLFVFVIMLLGPAADAPDDGAGRTPRWLGSGAAVCVGALSAMVVLSYRPERVLRPPSYGTLREVGGYLFGPAVLPFELASVLLTAAVVGAFAVARGHHDKVRLATGLGPDANNPLPSDKAPAAEDGEGPSGGRS